MKRSHGRQTAVGFGDCRRAWSIPSTKLSPARSESNSHGRFPDDGDATTTQLDQMMTRPTFIIVNYIIASIITDISHTFSAFFLAFGTIQKIHTAIELKNPRHGRHCAPNFITILKIKKEKNECCRCVLFNSFIQLQ